MRKTKSRIAIVAMSLIACGVLSGCHTPKNVAYFQDETVDVIPLTQNSGQIKIMPHDKLSIVVKSKDPSLSGLFNLTVTTDRLAQDNPTSGTGSSLRSYSGTPDGISKYTVTANGDIDFPVLGMLHVEGMTRGELSGFIKGELMGQNLVKDPVVTVEFLNVGFSVMGEVASPGRYDLNKDKINVLEALSLAGDMTIQGQRENVMLIREDKTGIHSYRLDMTNLSELAKSPAFYIRQGDVIYVEPNDVRKRQTTANGNNVLSASFWVSIASLLTSAVTSIAVFVK